MRDELVLRVTHGKAVGGLGTGQDLSFSEAVGQHSPKASAMAILPIPSAEHKFSWAVAES